MAITVRPMTKDDLPAYIKMAAAFHANCPVDDLIPFDPEGAAAFLAGVMDKDIFRVVLAEIDGVPVGIAGAALHPMYFSPGNSAVQELWWWLSPDHRGSGAAKRMYADIENWARQSGAVAMFMVALHDANVERMANMYARSGFRPMERTFVKGLL